ncbi:MAG: RNA polymerase sigma factor [Flavobacteriales bacterium]|nr:RNA polymerase sigma factor [Flavobacteriales bacterium]
MSTDEELIALIKKNPNKGFRVLLQQYKEKVYWQIRRMVLTHDDADELTQMVFIKIFKNLNSFKGNSKLSTWIYRITTNETITFLNKKAKEKHISYDDYIQNKAKNLYADDFFSGEEIDTILQKALAQLPQQQNLIFKMRYYDELKFSEIAEILTLSEGGVKSSYHIAQKKIEELVKVKCEV